MPLTLGRYLEEVLLWNPRVGLISKQDPERTVARLVADSMFLWDQAITVSSAGDVARIVDVGSGGGFPGVVWKLISPKTSVLLVERREKKATFLDRLPAVLGLDGLDIYSGGAQEAHRLKRYQLAFDIGVTMAVSSPERSVALVDGFLRENGVFVTLISKSIDPPKRLHGRYRLARLIRTDPSPCAVYRKS